MKRVAIVTSEDFDAHEGLYVREDLAVKALRNLGFSVSFCIWTDPAVNWSEYQSIIIRNTWDYHLKIDKFLNWLKVLENQSLKILNCPEVIYKNWHKSYLKVLENHGVPVPPTLFYSKKSACPVLCEVMEQKGWHQVHKSLHYYVLYVNIGKSRIWKK